MVQCLRFAWASTRRIKQQRSLAVRWRFKAIQFLFNEVEMARRSRPRRAGHFLGEKGRSQPAQGTWRCSAGRFSPSGEALAPRANIGCRARADGLLRHATTERPPEAVRRRLTRQRAPKLGRVRAAQHRLGRARRRLPGRRRGCRRAGSARGFDPVERGARAGGEAADAQTVRHRLVRRQAPGHAAAPLP